MTPDGREGGYVRAPLSENKRLTLPRQIGTVPTCLMTSVRGSRLPFPPVAVARLGRPLPASPVRTHRGGGGLHT
jgi:hypothetical protein